MSEDRLPTPRELADSPELAVLFLLDMALEATARALTATYPELAEEDFERWATKKSFQADRLVSLAFRLQSALARYRYEVSKEQLSQATEDTEIVF